MAVGANCQGTGLICVKYSVPSTRIYSIQNRDEYIGAVQVIYMDKSETWYGSGHETVAVLLPGFAINW